MTDPTAKDYAFLFLFKLAGGEVTNKQVEQLFGIKLSKNDYLRLNAGGWVKSETPRGRPYWHRLTPLGEKLLDGELVIASTKYDPLSRVLPILHELYRKAPATTPAAPPPDGRPLKERIRSAYAELTDAAGGEWVRLADLRQKLAGISKRDFHTALKELFREPDVRLEPEPNSHRIKATDRDAAVTIGGEDRHKMAIEMP